MRAAAALCAVLAGCSDEAPRRCTATSPTERHAVELDERGLPRDAWTWDGAQLVAHTRFEHDDRGRLVSEARDSRTASLEVGPDGAPDLVFTTAYTGAEAVVTERGADPAADQTRAIYTFDEAGRVVRAELRSPTREVHTRAYDSNGRVVRASISIERPLPTTEVRELAYGPDGRPATMRVERDRTVDFAWTYSYDDAPGRTLVRLWDGDFEASPFLFERDGAGRLTRAERRPRPEDAFSIGHGADGAVSVLRGSGELFVFTEACGALFEEPRGPAPAPSPRAQTFALPELPNPY